MALFSVWSLYVKNTSKILDIAYLKKIYYGCNQSSIGIKKIPLVHNRTIGTVHPKSTSKLRSALHIRYSIVIPRFIFRANTPHS